ncbi:MAG TPA: hypothetical protein VG454_09545 [Gemmatimonadales bacterium]|nr:hypothetical protein [Gemmatimonadales bacterium]
MTAIHPPSARDDVIVSYLTLRKVVGVLGMALPVVVAVWGLVLEGRLLPTVSDYYSLRTRDAFVGILFTIAWFLFTYHGYERQDDIAGNCACVLALAVALFPNRGTPFEATVHYLSATGLFLVLAYFALFLFTKSGPVQTHAKLLRNRVYRVCGVVMLVCIALIAFYQLALSHTSLAALRPVFWLETTALWAFGFSWFVKGEAILKD